APGEALVDRSLQVGVGKTVQFGGRTFHVVGVLDNTSFYFGTPTVFLPITEAQQTLLSSQPLASAIVGKGTPTSVPPQFSVLTGDQVRRDLDRTLTQSAQTLDLINFLLWVVAAGIIGSIIYMSALERLRDFAVLKASGASNRALMGGLAL